MAKLLSGNTLRRGGSGEFLDLKGAMPQLPPSPSTSTGFTLITDSLFRTFYRSSLGNLEFTTGTVFSNIANGNIVLAGTGTGNVQVIGGAISTQTNSGALVIQGGVGVENNIITGDDIIVNGLTIGQGYEGLNNIVIKGTASPQIDEFSNGQQSIAIGYDVLQGLDTAYKTIAIGRNAISSGTGVRDSIAIGDNALKIIGTEHFVYIGAISGVPQVNPVRLTVNSHQATSGTHVTITGVNGMTELNDGQYWVKVINANTVELYTDDILNIGLDGSGFNSYISGGTLSRILDWNENIAIGTNAGINLIDGKQNFFLGYNVATSFSTGSYNFFVGHNVANNMTTGSANISIGGDNLEDGKDNQINIGSVFYYNGFGYLQLNAETGVGLGTTATSKSTGSLSVLGGAAITDNVIIGGGVNAISTDTGDLVVYGGGGIGNDLYVGGTIFGTATTATNIANGLRGSLPFQTSTGQTFLLEIGTTGTVLLSDGEVPRWETIANISVNTATNANNLLVSEVTSNTVYYMVLSELIGNYTPTDADYNFNYSTTASTLTVPNVLISSTQSSTSTTTGALIVQGGIGVQGNIYSPNGNEQESGLLYTPQVTITNTGIPPATAKVGDFWIDASLGAQMQYIKDGTSTFWIQITTI